MRLKRCESGWRKFRKWLETRKRDRLEACPALFVTMIQRQNQGASSIFSMSALLIDSKAPRSVFTVTVSPASTALVTISFFPPLSVYILLTEGAATGRGAGVAAAGFTSTPNETSILLACSRRRRASVM